VDGNLWCSWGMGTEGFDGVSVFNPAGKLIGRVDVPERWQTCAPAAGTGRIVHLPHQGGKTMLTLSDLNVPLRRL
jgi:sugar lactone lactonase YvrE